MKLFCLLLFSVFLFANCKEGSDESKVGRTETETVVVIDSIEVDKNELVLNQLEGKWYLNDLPFNGYAVKYYTDGTLEERLGFYKGKREGIAKRWSKNGVLRVESYYKQNRLVGTYKSWWENGELGSEANYIDGKMNGTVKEWYPSGQLSKERQLVAGKEVGMQKAWLKNGTLYVNYEARNGRIFGMKRANSCYQLEDEVVVRSK